MEYSEKIRCVREKLGMSQEELAHELKVSNASIHRWENAKTKPIKVARAAFYDFCDRQGIVFSEQN